MGSPSRSWASEPTVMMLPSEVWSGATTALVSSGQMLNWPFTRTAPKRSPVEQRRSTATSVVRPAARSNMAEPWQLVLSSSELASRWTV